MEYESQLIERLEHAATLLERRLAWLEERGCTGEIPKICAAVDPAVTAREEELAGKLAAAEAEIAELRAAATLAASAQTPAGEAQRAPQAAVRKTAPAAAADMLAKHGIGETPVDVRTLDAALAGLSLEQRIAVKSQLLRAGALA